MKNLKNKAPTNVPSLPPHWYFVESLGVIQDILTLAPQMLRVLGYGEKNEQKALALPLPPTCKRAGLSNPTAWQAQVEVIPGSEEECLREIKKKSPPFVMACDHITDAGNLGAILRSTAFFQVPWLVVPKDRQASLSQGAIQTAQGGYAVTRLAQVVNLARFLKALKEEGYWILGADRQGEPCQNLKGFYEKVCLVMGSEDKGLSPVIRAACDRMVAIAPGSGRLNSLNVSVASGILLHEFHK